MVQECIFYGKKDIRSSVHVSMQIPNKNATYKGNNLKRKVLVTKPRVILYEYYIFIARNDCTWATHMTLFQVTYCSHPDAKVCSKLNQIFPSLEQTRVHTYNTYEYNRSTPWSWMSSYIRQEFSCL
jgi:hypothetical protein